MGAATGEIVAFAEVGMLPPPPGYLPAEAAAVESGVGLEGKEEEENEEEDEDGEEEEEEEDVPYLANLCVAAAARRRGLAGRLVAVCAKWAAGLDKADAAADAAEDSSSGSSGALFATVDESAAAGGRNDAARALYEGLGFTLVPPSTDVSYLLTLSVTKSANTSFVR